MELGNRKEPQEFIKSTPCNLNKEYFGGALLANVY